MQRLGMQSIAGLLCGLATMLAAFAREPDRVEFNRDIRPILADACFACHGPDSSRREAALRLDVRDAAIEAGAIVPEKPDASALIERVLSDDPDLQMPPPQTRKTLSEEQKELLRRWIEQGAEYQQHWAYEPPRRPNIPAGEKAIDYLVRRRLDEKGVAPSPPADRRTLIRRLYSDLLGLLPTPEEVEAFEKDARSDAYERLVEKILASPHYGERMAIGWLDVVRFADTIGYHSDNPRNVWPYRDWVIRSFNDNKPFDRFTLEQIAGDLLPDATLETRVGSAFNRLLLTTEEGGAQPKDYEARMLADRVRAIGAAWLGQTTGCAQCHDHKFDPFTMRDFYSLGAFFADVEEASIGRREEGMLVPSEEEAAKLAELDKLLAEAEAKAKGPEAELNAAQAEWEKGLAEGGGAETQLAEQLQSLVGDDESAKKAALATAKALKTPTAKRSVQERGTITSFYRTHINRSHREVLAWRDQLQRQRQQLVRSIPRCLVSKSAPTPRTVRILPRGNWMDESGEIVAPAFPHYLPQPPPVDRRLTRLDLAQWLVSRENPLTARTVVNRLWSQFFGAALSRVPADLGAQGEPPTHPELLDWLACEFMESGWDVKHLVRTIVLSETYRQSSAERPELAALDPDNRLLARQNVFRVDAELVRDYALGLAGLLSPRIGGPSVKPYQPDGYWENLNFPQREYVIDRGDAQYRRGLYVWWQRTFLHPSLLAFDAPSREECASERARSNIPQQALVLLNDPTYVEASRAFAERILSDGPKSTEERIEWAWRQAVQRSPDAQERRVVAELLEKQLAAYRNDPQAVDARLQVGLSKPPEEIDSIELAAWTHVARVILNLHEMITRR